jgi:hypothetical protein
MQDTGESIIAILKGRSTCTAKNELALNDLIQFCGPDSKAIFVDLFHMYSFEGDRVPINLVVRFLESGRLPLKDLPRKNKKDHLQTEARLPRGTDKGATASAALENDKSLVLYANTIGKATSTPDSKDDFWKKHETVITERIVRHLTVKNGVSRLLVETDKSQNEIVHIECNSSGEFAHREYSQQEQTEELDNEMPTFIRATEEYVHFKNANDEYEYVHSNIPSTSNDNKDDSYDEGGFDSSDESFMD